MMIPKIIKETLTYNGFLKIKEAELEFSNQLTKRNSMLYKSNAVAILLFNSDNNSFIFTKQYRYPIFHTETDGVILEIVAGTIDGNELPENTAKREIMEEVGYQCEELEVINSCYSSPGYSSEKIHLFLSVVKNSDKIPNAGGGLVEHGEFIETIELPVEQVYDMLSKGEINDLKTIAALQYFKEKHFMSIVNLLTEEKNELYNKIKDLELKLVILQSKPKL